MVGNCVICNKPLEVYGNQTFDLRITKLQIHNHCLLKFRDDIVKYQSTISDIDECILDFKDCMQRQDKEIARLSNRLTDLEDSSLVKNSNHAKDHRDKKARAGNQ